MTWRGWRYGHTRGITPAEFAAMVEGHRFANNNMLELVQYGVYYILQPYMTTKTSIERFWGWKRKTTEMDPEEMKKRKAAAKKLLRKIETAQIAKREVVGAFAGRGK